MRTKRYLMFIGMPVLGLVLAWGCTDGARLLGDAMVEAGSSLRDSAADAAAQDGCSRWEYARQGTGVVGTVYPVEPAGFEPFAASDGYVFVRRCAP